MNKLNIQTLIDKQSYTVSYGVNEGKILVVEIAVLQRMVGMPGLQMKGDKWGRK